MNHVLENVVSGRRLSLLTGLGLTILIALTCAARPSYAQSPRTARVECNSENHTRKLCPVEAPISSLRVVDKKSRAACIEGNSYGIGDKAIWVDKGCVAIFEVTFQNRNSQGSSSRISTRPGNRPGYTDRDTESASMYCGSKNNGHNTCSVGGEIVSLRPTRQRSQARCQDGVSYGYNDDEIWVDKGCAADFEVQFRTRRTSTRPSPNARPDAPYAPSRPGMGNSQWPAASNDKVTLSCKSNDFKRNSCEVPGSIISAVLIETKSRAACSKGNSYGYSNDAIWVDRGCDGVFEVTYRVDRNPTQTQSISCESRNYAREECFAGGRITDIRIRNNRSKVRCVQNTNFGYKNDTIWVSNGCVADFDVTYRPR